MSSFNELDEYPSLAKSFDEQLDAYYKIENSSYPSNSNDYQIQVSDCIRKLEELTKLISQIGVFSSNERFSELATSSIKFLLLPILLGSLTLKQIGSSSRKDILKIAEIYLKDFLNRCKEYDLTNVIIYNEEESVENDDNAVTDSKSNAMGSPITKPPTSKELLGMASQRAEKIKRYKEIKATEEKLKELKTALKTPNCDEDTIRDYYTTMIDHFVCKSVEELEAIAMEQKVLSHMKTMDKNKDEIGMKSQKSTSLRPFLITKDDAQKKVFGAGYPSLPVMSVDEFYEQRSKEEWFIAKSDAILSENSEDASKSQKKSKKPDPDDESDEEVERLRQRDEWRDDHRRGWGNTYNRS